MLRIGDVQNHIGLVANFTVQSNTPKVDLKNGAPTCSEQVIETTYAGDSMTQTTAIGDVFTTRRTQKVGNEQTVASRLFQTLKRQDNRYLNSFTPDSF